MSEWLTVVNDHVGKIVGIGASVAALAVYGKRIAKVVKAFVEVPARLERIEDELKPNGGFSIFDVVNRLDRNVAVVGQGLAIVKQVVWASSDESVPMFQCDAQGLVVRVNRAFCILLGMQPDDLYGTGWKVALSREDTERVDEDLNEAIDRGQDYVTELKFVHRETRVPVTARVAWRRTIVEGGGKPHAWVGVVWPLKT